MVAFAQWLARTLTAGERTAGGYSRRLLFIWLWTLEAAVADGVATVGLLVAWTVTGTGGLYTAGQWCIRFLYVLAVFLAVCMAVQAADKPQTGGDK